MGADRRFSVTMPEELYQQFEHFRYANKFSTQTKAAVFLVQRGLDSLREPVPASDDDVVITDARTQLMDIRFSQLDDADRAALYSYAGYLLDQEKYKSTH